jgi:hypothetical protein
MGKKPTELTMWMNCETIILILKMGSQKVIHRISPENGMMEISSVKSSIRGWERLCVPIRHNTGKGVFQLHVDRDTCKGSTDTPKEATL